MFVCVCLCVCTDRNLLDSSLRRKCIFETFHLCLRSQSLQKICWRTLILHVWLPCSLLTVTVAERITAAQYPHSIAIVNNWTSSVSYSIHLKWLFRAWMIYWNKERQHRLFYLMLYGCTFFSSSFVSFWSKYLYHWHLKNK